MKVKGISSILSLVLMLCVVACSDIDSMVEEIGSLRLYPLDPALAQGTLGAGAELNIQVAEWHITRAAVTLDGQDNDLLAGEGFCAYADTAISLPYLTDSASGEYNCAYGIVVGAMDTPQEATLGITLTMDVRRVSPLVLPPDGDYDEDGVLNDVDICPLVADSEQLDEDPEDGIGDECDTTDVYSPGEYYPDMDGDGVRDSVDNCVWIQNVLQEDSADIPPGFPANDGIGDACADMAQTATVYLNGNSEFDLASSTNQFTQDVYDLSYYVVDFSDDVTLDCDWDAQSCTLDDSQVQFCIVDGSTATLGCP